MIKNTISKKIKRVTALQPFFSSVMPVVLINTLISMLISFPVLRHGYQDSSLYEIPLGLLPFISHYFMLNLAMGIITYMLMIALRPMISTFLSILLFFLSQTILLIDTKIYTIFHYHINSLVLNVITTEGVSDSVILGKETIFTFLLLLLPVFVIEILIHIFFSPSKQHAPGSRLLAFERASRVFFFVGLCLIVIDKGVYAYGDIVNDTRITKTVRLYPLYQPLTVKRFAKRVLRINVNREQDFKVSKANNINYPREKLVFDTSKDKKYNIILLVIEGLRFDMLDKEIMPNTSAFGQKNIIYANHYSGGNGSRFGVFSLIYGIHGSYWHNFLARRISPVLINTLIDKGYDFKILSSTLLTFPEFRKTAFVRIPDSIEDQFSTDSMPERDKIITEKLIYYMSTRKQEKPFFAFLFYNSSHQSYKYPEQFEKFQPVIKREDINYFVDTEKDKAYMIRNRYRNAVFYIDHLLGKIFSSLEKNNLMKNTIVVITGDHGEEFYENGYFGHTSAFDDYQLKTVFVLHVPGAGNRIVQRITSHSDLPATIMELLGCTSPPGYYSQGISLLGSKGHNYVLSANWDTAAIIDENFKIVFSTELHNISRFEVHSGKDYVPVENYRELLRSKNQDIKDVLLKMTEFYK